MNCFYIIKRRIILEIFTYKCEIMVAEGTMIKSFMKTSVKHIYIQVSIKLFMRNDLCC